MKNILMLIFGGGACLWPPMSRRCCMQHHGGGAAMKTLLFLFARAFVLLCFQLPRASTVWDTPFLYLEKAAPDSAMKPSDGYIFIRPAYAQSFIGINRQWEASVLPGTGLGVVVERSISINHQWYSALALSINGLFRPIVGRETAFAFSGSILLGTQLSGLGIFGVGPGFDGKQVSCVIGCSGKIF